MRDEANQHAESKGHFADRLHAAIGCLGTPACVGLDPVLEKLPSGAGVAQGAGGKGHAPGAADRIEAFCAGVIEAVAGVVPIVKPQSACFERYGQAGIGVLKRTIQLARSKGLVVILDAKRGDIGTTAEHYAAATFGNEKTNPAQAADAVTLNGYMGMDTVEPFLGQGDELAGTHGVFVLVRTSNPGSDAIQTARLGDGRTVAELVADEVSTLGATSGRIGACGLSCVGAVVGATKSSEGEALRKHMPNQVLLVPGYGAQGGTLDDIRPLLRSRTSAADAGVVVNASRSVIYAFKPGSAAWINEVRAAAQAFADDLRSLTK